MHRMKSNVHIFQKSNTASINILVLRNCTAVEALTLPASLSEIGDWAFNPIIRDLPDEAITVVEGSYAAEYIVPFR